MVNRRREYDADLFKKALNKLPGGELSRLNLSGFYSPPLGATK
jgi:hypothetical protein